MTEIIIACSYVYGSALELDCDEEPQWKIILAYGELPSRVLISCDHHLADLARDGGSILSALSITLEALT